MKWELTRGSPPTTIFFPALLCPNADTYLIMVSGVRLWPTIPRIPDTLVIKFLVNGTSELWQN
jgi:hypothetical protein